MRAASSTARMRAWTGATGEPGSVSARLHMLTGAKGPAVDRQLERSRNLAAGVDKGRRQPAGLELAENALDVVVAGADREVGDALSGRRIEGRQAKAQIAGRPAGGADEVGRQAPQLMEHERGLLVQVGIELNAALLGDDAAEMF